MKQFVRNSCIRLWMDSRKVGKYDLQKYCTLQAHDFPFADELNSMARLASADQPGLQSPDSTITARIRSLIKKDGVAELRYELSRNRDI